MKKVSIILALAIMVVLATAGAAFANFGPHGGYALDTDACAGCHRAHTSFSEVTWTNAADDQQSALLVSSASTLQEFCYACHGADAPGAATNVEEGLFDSGPSGEDGQLTGGGILYETNSSFGGALNGGAFAGSTSMHNMELGSVTDPMWGAGMSAPTGSGLTCGSCHDVHGSSNYRLLKDSLTPWGGGSANTVGGYDGSDNPQAYVFSSEEGYPDPLVEQGWKKHQDGANQMQLYRPNYTTPQYLAALTNTYVPGGRKLSMSTWCAGCHEEYDQSVGAFGNPSATNDYGVYESTGAFSRSSNTATLTVTGGTALGARTRHRHPVDVPVNTANTINGFGTNAVTSTVLPLEKTPGNLGDAAGDWQLSDQLGCLTCHFAHGTDKTMSGWANARLVNNPSAVTTWSVEPTTALAGVAPAGAGVNPNISSALLRADNRGVCERCHNK